MIYYKNIQKPMKTVHKSPERNKYLHIFPFSFKKAAKIAKKRVIQSKTADKMPCGILKSAETR